MIYALYAFTQLLRRLINAGDQLDATPPSYLFALQWARATNAVLRIRCRWVRWRDSTRALVRCNSDVSASPCSPLRTTYLSPSFR